MGAPHGGHLEAEVYRLIEQERQLRERLHRVTVALALSEEMMADAYERLAARDRERGPQWREDADRARATADQCRTFIARLEMLTQL